jgi:bifunctional UDP-N-acetylglucosamine pyrophosphorylase / glucosamine-1-phosphate N-acetyltransferase
LSENIDNVLVLQGDDTAFYTGETLLNFVDKHINNKMILSLLTAEVEDPGQLGRVVRHENGGIEVIEKEYTTEEQKKIKEISTGTFCFDRNWFENMFLDMPKLRKLGEYALPTTLAMARENKQPHQVIKLKDSSEWFGVNTKEQLEEANNRKKKN